MSDDLWDKKYQALTAMIDRLLEEKDDLSATLRNAEEKYEEAKYKFSDCMHCIKQIKQEKQQMRMDLR
jgi:chromosome segregation ATPase